MFKFTENQKVKLTIPDNKGQYLTGRFKELIAPHTDFANVVFDHHKPKGDNPVEPVTVPIWMLEPK